MSIGDQIRILREKCNITQNKLAVNTGTTQHYISLIERDEREPNRRLLSSIVGYLLKSTKVSAKEFSSLMVALIQDILPGSNCISDDTSMITIELPDNIRADLTLIKKAYHPLTLKLFDSILANLISNLELSIKETRLRKMAEKLSLLKDDQYSLVEGVLDNLT